MHSVRSRTEPAINQPAAGAIPKRRQPTWNNHRVSTPPDNSVISTCDSPQGNIRQKPKPYQRLQHRQRQTAITPSSITNVNRETPALENCGLPREAVRLILSLTTKNQNYIYFGSMALYLQGMKVSPSDIDIVCTPASQKWLTEALKKHQLNSNPSAHYQLHSMDFSPALPELNIPAITAITVRNKNDKNEQLHVDLLSIEQHHMEKTYRTSERVYIHEEGFEIYTEPLPSNVMRLINNNSFFIRAYLNEDYFQYISSEIRGTILFNGEETVEARVCSILMRALMSAKKTKELLYTLNHNKMGHLDYKELISNLEASLYNLLARVKTHSHFDEFRKQVYLRTSLIYADNSSIKNLIQSIMAVLDTEPTISDKWQSPLPPCHYPQPAAQAAPDLSVHNNHHSTTGTTTGTALNPEARGPIPEPISGQTTEMMFFSAELLLSPGTDTTSNPVKLDPDISLLFSQQITLSKKKEKKRDQLIADLTMHLKDSPSLTEIIERLETMDNFIAPKFKPVVKAISADLTENTIINSYLSLNSSGKPRQIDPGAKLSPLIVQAPPYIEDVQNEHIQVLKKVFNINISHFDITSHEKNIYRNWIIFELLQSNFVTKIKSYLSTESLPNATDLENSIKLHIKFLNQAMLSCLISVNKKNLERNKDYILDVIFAYLIILVRTKGLTNKVTPPQNSTFNSEYLQSLKVILALIENTFIKKIFEQLSTDEKELSESEIRNPSKKETAKRYEKILLIDAIKGINTLLEKTVLQAIQHTQTNPEYLNYLENFIKSGSNSFLFSPAISKDGNIENSIEWIEHLNAFIQRLTSILRDTSFKMKPSTHCKVLESISEWLPVLSKNLPKLAGAELAEYHEFQYDRDLAKYLNDPTKQQQVQPGHQKNNSGLKTPIFSLKKKLIRLMEEVKKSEVLYKNDNAFLKNLIQEVNTLAIRIGESTTLTDRKRTPLPRKKETCKGRDSGSTDNIKQDIDNYEAVRNSSACQQQEPDTTFVQSISRQIQNFLKAIDTKLTYHEIIAIMESKIPAVKSNPAICFWAYTDCALTLFHHKKTKMATLYKRITCLHNLSQQLKRALTQFPYESQNPGITSPYAYLDKYFPDKGLNLINLLTISKSIDLTAIQDHLELIQTILQLLDQAWVAGEKLCHDKTPGHDQNKDTCIMSFDELAIHLNTIQDILFHLNQFNLSFQKPIPKEAVLEQRSLLFRRLNIRSAFHTNPPTVIPSQPTDYLQLLKEHIAEEKKSFQNSIFKLESNLNADKLRRGYSSLSEILREKAPSRSQKPSTITQEAGSGLEVP